MAFRKRRCLILADGFYEWQRQDRRKQPYFIRLRGGRPFAFAGLWEHWEDPDGSPLDTCSILATTPNDLLCALHDRMPVILPPEDYALWLDSNIQEIERLQPLLRPYPAEEITAFPVSTRVNHPAHDAPECMAPVVREPEARSAP